MFYNWILRSTCTLGLIVGSAVAVLAQEADTSTAKPKQSLLDLRSPGAKITDPNSNGGVLDHVLKRQPFKKITFGGYYRFHAIHRLFSDPYVLGAANPTVGMTPRYLNTWDAYREPHLLLTINGRATAKTSFGTDIYMRNPLEGGDGRDNELSLYLGASLYGNFSTDVGSIYVTLGGINWRTLSTLTMYDRPNFQRYSIFERTPWEGVPSNDDKYGNFYAGGTLNQGARWNNKAFIGFWIDAVDLPKGFSFNGFYGKPQNQVFGTEAGELTPSEALGGRLSKSLKKGIVGLNTLNNYSYSDSVNGVPVGYNIVTADYDLKFKGISFIGEIGIGNYHSETINTGWGEGVDFNVAFPKEKLGFPLEVELFRLSPAFVNTNAAFANTSVVEAVPTSETGNVLSPAASPLTNVGQMANNRQGINLNTGYDIGPLKMSVGYSNSREIDRMDNGNVLTYTHRVNSLAFSRFAFYPYLNDLGAYGRTNIVFRGVYENVTIADQDTANNIQLIDSTGKPLFDKYFNTIETRLKYKTSVLGRNLYAFYVNTLNSVQDKPAAIPIFNSSKNNYADNAAFFTFQAHELDIYYELDPRITLAVYLGYERTIANRNTDIDTGVIDPQTAEIVAEATLNPRDQVGKALGLGFDIDVAKNVGLFLRHRWFSYEDKNFALEKYKGTETRLEIKILF